MKQVQVMITREHQMKNVFSFGQLNLIICYLSHLEVNLSFDEWEDMRQ